MRPKTDLAEPMTDTFVGDFALFHDQEKSRFLRCSIYDISGAVMIYCIDEGFTKTVEPTNRYRMPLKLRQVDNNELDPKQVNFWRNFVDLNLMLSERSRFSSCQTRDGQRQ